MKIYQPMLFVGLGGTGGRIGAELEQGLRRELCGPDGTRLVAEGRRAPFQLPDCLQFVYADFSESELDQLPHLSAKGGEAAAYARTSRVIHDLLPTNYDTSPEVTRMLRVALHEETHSWLPPKERQPRVAPLHNGAGQLPTVGRAALFATLRSGLEPVLRQLREAIGAISNCAGDLREMGGRQIRGCDVFVAFSVAGGTGAGIFYDFIHLVAHEFRKSRVPGVKIYPLVVMPSAFPPQAGGGREAELNSARALVDLSRLVDSQNVPDAESDFGDVAQHHPHSVRYPEEGVITMRPSTVQTALLLSLTSGIRPEDLRRSVTAMVLSLIATELGDESRQHSEGDYQSFAASFVNKSVERSKPARSGIGFRGMSTCLAASLTVPVDDLAELVAGRLLSQAVVAMEEDANRLTESGTERIVDMFERSGIDRLWYREAHEVPDPDPLPKGSKDIGQALRDRIGEMEDALKRLRGDLGRDIPALAEGFKPGQGVRELLGRMDPFKLEKVFAGQPGHPQRAAEAGFAGMLENRKNDPERPQGVEVSAPHVPRIKGGVGGLVPARWGDPDVREALEAQDRWYVWQANRHWHNGWREYETRWRPPLLRAMKEVGELVGALRNHRKDEPKQFADRRKELYREDRKGVKYLLPPQNNLRAFYDEVYRRLVQHEGLPENADAAALIAKLVRPEHWQLALDAVRRSPRAAVKEIKQVVEQRVKGLFGETGLLNDRPLLPPLGVLLRAVSGDEEAESTVDPRLLDQFRSQLAALLPVGFVPDGSGPLKVLIVHPRSEADSSAARYLSQQLNLPREPDVAPEFQAVDTESITVVLFRSGMSLTDVSEARHVLRLWAQARDADGEDDFLHWRQRLGYRDDWLASTEDDRRRILHRILCAVWNGAVDVLGDPASPEMIRIRLQEGDAATMTLRLDSYDQSMSSWAGLLRAYEQWALLDEGEIIEDVCARLMRTQPRGLAHTPVPPSTLFTTLVHEVAPRQRALLQERSGRFDAEDEEWLVPLRHFWEETFPGALDLRFPGAQKPIRSNLTLLDAAYASHGHAHSDRPDRTRTEDRAWHQGDTGPAPEDRRRGRDERDEFARSGRPGPADDDGTRRRAEYGRPADDRRDDGAARARAEADDRRERGAPRDDGRYRRRAEDDDRWEPGAARDDDTVRVRVEPEDHWEPGASRGGDGAARRRPSTDEDRWEPGAARHRASADDDRWEPGASRAESGSRRRSDDEGFASANGRPVEDRWEPGAAREERGGSGAGRGDDGAARRRASADEDGWEPGATREPPAPADGDRWEPGASRAESGSRRRSDDEGFASANGRPVEDRWEPGAAREERGGSGAGRGDDGAARRRASADDGWEPGATREPSAPADGDRWEPGAARAESGSRRRSDDEGFTSANGRPAEDRWEPGATREPPAPRHRAPADDDRWEPGARRERGSGRGRDEGDPWGAGDWGDWGNAGDEERGNER